MGRLQHGLSFDIEDWYQSCVSLTAPISVRVRTNTYRLLRLLAETGTKATFFFQGLVAKTYPELVRAALAEGHEIGSHGHSHQSVFLLGEKGFQRDLRQSLEILEDIVGEKVKAFRAPDFSLHPERTPWAWPILWEAGLEYDSSIYPFSGRRYGVPQAPLTPYVAYEREGRSLWEVPLCVLTVGRRRLPVAGGGYIRHFPRWVLPWIFRQLEGQNRAGIFYFHPYELDTRETWELGRKQSLGVRIFMLRQGFLRETVEGKLRFLCRHYSFVPIGEVLSREKTTLPKEKRLSSKSLSTDS